MIMCQKLLYKIQLPYTISFLRRIFERNIDEKYYVLIIQFMNGSKIYSTILPCQVWETLHWCMLWLWIPDISALLWAPFLQAVFHSSESHYDLGCRDICQMAMSTHISRFWQNHFKQVSGSVVFTILLIIKFKIILIEYIKMLMTYDNFQKCLLIS